MANSVPTPTLSQAYPLPFFDLEAAVLSTDLSDEELDQWYDRRQEAVRHLNEYEPFDNTFFTSSPIRGPSWPQGEHDRSNFRHLVAMAGAWGDGVMKAHLGAFKGFCRVVMEFVMGIHNELAASLRSTCASWPQVKLTF
jgi:hypothetical protein